MCYSVYRGTPPHGVAINQDGERVALALPATVSYQDPMSRATTGGLATVTVREHSSHADARPVPAAPSLRAGPPVPTVRAGV